MLNRAKLAQALNEIADSIFIDSTQERELLKKLWQQLCQDPLLQDKISRSNISWPMPSWHADIDNFLHITPHAKNYDLISVDGSQIYPDRHSGVSCYLINIGEIVLRYGHREPVAFYAEPFVFSGEDDEELQPSTELINGKRQDLELRYGLERARQTKSADRPKLLLFDGSLIFWHLEAKDPMLKELFLSRYLHTLMQLWQEKIIFASYISSPKSREIMNVVRAYGCDFDESKQERVAALSRFTDAGLLSMYLQEGQRTQVFKNHAKVSELYPDPVHPYFFYLHVGDEIGRIELPAYLALDDQQVDFIAATIYDQCKKGMGYPVALAEAHEQAVVKGPDRDFFYQLLNKMSIERNRQLLSSSKLMKKRGMGI